MNNGDTLWLERLQILLGEVRQSKNAYQKVLVLGKYPDANVLFQVQFEQRAAFEKALLTELNVHNRSARPISKSDNDYIYGNLGYQVDKKNIAIKMLDEIIIENEKLLVLRYQDLLATKNLPSTTDAILQSQVEQINVNLQKLKLNYNTTY